MNCITMYGRLGKDAESFQIRTENGEKKMITFPLVDYGLPNQKGEPMSMEVHFVKDMGLSILPDLLKGREVVVSGFVTEKKYVTQAGESRSKKYISASIVQFVGKAPENNREDGV